MEDLLRAVRPPMQLHKARRRHAGARWYGVLIATALALAALLHLVQPRRLHVLPGRTTTEVEAAVLLPDWEVLVLLRPGAAQYGTGNSTCSFLGGASTPARPLGPATSGRRAYTCVVPAQVRKHKTIRAPRLVPSSSPSSLMVTAGGDVRSPKMLRWSRRLVYESVVVDGGDVLVFAKGVSRAASVIQCVYYRASGDHVVAMLPAVAKAQQVFRCPPPPTPTAPAASSGELRVTLAVAGEEPLPSLAVYSRPPRAGYSGTSKKLVCACTMVRDVAKFLREWVVYHAAVGVDRFYLYDNGSKDELMDQVHQLSSDGYDVSIVAWPWSKAQEAGFSHSAAVHRGSCEWMAFVDVDEFIFSPRWNQSEIFEKSMLHSVVSSVEPHVGQVKLGCANFGPSGQTASPEEGVTQGYTCRRRAHERHKSLLRLDAVDGSFVNSIHHFVLRPGFRDKWNKRVRVNHYKYQAWGEFQVKFRRRVSTYVVDWTNPVSLNSKDRTPGLGFEAMEPVGWKHMFCEVNDTLLRDVTRRWFGVGFGGGKPRTTHGSWKRKPI